VSLYDDILEELKSRGVYKYEVFAPYFISSIGCHIFNLHNIKEEVYFEAKEVPSLRMHILFVAPPGMSKTFFMKQFLMGKYALLKGTGITMGLEQSMTGAAFVGTILNVQGDLVITDGAAKIYADGVLGVDEFSAITRALQAQYNTELDTQLLAALDHGNVYKRLGAGKIEYNTQLTLWAGIQPARFDLTSGMGRRFLYLVFFPTRKEADELLHAWWKSKNIRPVMTELNKLRLKLRQLMSEVKMIRKVEFADDIFREYKRIGLFPYEGSYFDRLLIGYWIMQYGPENRMVLSLKNDAELRRLVNTEVNWRRQVMIDAEVHQLVQLVREAGGMMKKEKLYEECILLGLDMSKTTIILERARRSGVVMVRGDEVIVND